MEGYLISGVPPGHGGAGKFFEHILPLAEEAGWKVLCRPAKKGKKKLSFLIKLCHFYLGIRKIRDCRVVVIHPQTLRWHFFIMLASRNKTALYVVDNSFFCIRSYNYRGQEWKECLDCVGDLDKCNPSCKPAPIHYNRHRNLEYLRRLKSLSKQIQFFSQNPQQAALVKRHFGPGVEVKTVGMITNQFTEKPDSTTRAPVFDIVYHGTFHPAKGVEYVLELARRLPDLSFLLPGRPEELPNSGYERSIPENVHFQDMRWETGLREMVGSCRLVLCPSLWSAPVEAALVKSIIHSGRAAVFNTRYGFHQDIPDNLLIRLGDDLPKAAEKIRRVLEMEAKKAVGVKWVEGLRQKADLAALFR